MFPISMYLHPSLAIIFILHYSAFTATGPNKKKKQSASIFLLVVVLQPPPPPKRPLNMSAGDGSAPSHIPAIVSFPNPLSRVSGLGKLTISAPCYGPDLTP